MLGTLKETEKGFSAWKKVIEDLRTVEKIVAMTLFLECHLPSIQTSAHAAVSVEKELQDHFFFRLISPTAQDSGFSSFYVLRLVKSFLSLGVTI